jgi:ubiquinone/menaquinone biosynthesis C-methylase UbiE
MSKWGDIWARFHGRGVYPHELAFLLRLPLRDLVFSRSELVRALRLNPNSAVLEIGPGPGFFSPSVARAIPAGHLELLDLQLPMLRKARRRIRRAKLSNVHFTCASAIRLPYRDDTFDAAFLVAVLGEVDAPPDCVREVARVLRPGGILSVTELPGDPDAVPRETVDSWSTACGFHVVRCSPVRRGYSLTLELRS